MEAMRLAGKVALVTGAQQGIGRAMALAFARHGADVALNYLDDKTAAESVATDVRAHGRRAVLIQGDVSRAADAQAMVATTVKELGPPDALVNNAGVYPRVSFLDMRESDWDQVLDVNLKGSFLCAQAAARAMVAAGRGGAIVNLASSAIRGAPLGVHYSASKGGVVTMTRAMALALAPHHIRVNAIAPGTTDTAQPRYEHSEETMQEIGRAIPLGRLGQPADVADVAVFLASAAARWITGQTIHVNGGQYMR
jgi:NAD(P)-dependent dehydrogenase (short-subunit alcohol dehydrogenase family)